MTLFRIVLAIALAIYGLAAQAQALPKPKEFYFDEDASARPIVVVKGEGEALAQELIKARSRGRKMVEATAQLAHVAMAEKRLDLGKQLYQQALSSAQEKGGLWRSIRWNYGWDLYQAGEYQPAFSQWALLVDTMNSYDWVPATIALSLWSLDRKREAVEWYAAAVRTEPNLWNDPANYPKLLPDWREQDRKRLSEVFTAWKNDR